MNLSSVNIHSLSEALAWTIFHSIWQAALIAGLLAIAFCFLNKNNAQLRYTMASLSMLLIFVSAIFTFLLSLPAQTLPLNLNLSGLDSIIITDTNKDVFSWGSLKSLLPTHIIFPILLRTWMIGICLLSVRMLINYTTALRLKKHKAFPLNDKHMTLAYNVLEHFKIRKKILFRESASIDSPSLIGYFKPVILLPISLISGIPNNQLEIIIAHELAHISRHDYLFQFIQGIIEILFFYHPMVWWLSSVVNTEREHICDDLAVKVCGESLTLIKALNNMESIRRKKPELVLSFSGKKANLLYRVRRILNPVTVKHPKLERGLMSALFVFVLSGMILFSNLANSKNQVQVESKNSTILSFGDIDSYEMSHASPIIHAPQKKVKKNKTALAPSKVVEPVKPAVTIIPVELPVVTETPELNKNVLLISDTLKQKEVEEEIKVHKEALEKYLKKVEKDVSLNKKEKTEARNRVHNSLKWVQSKEFKRNTKMTVKLDSSAPIHISAPKISFDSGKVDAPLYILDGVEVSKQALDNVDTDAFESITILKDAASIRVYGAKGKNGVILITSKNKLDHKKKAKKIGTIKIKGKTKNPPLYIVDGVAHADIQSMKDIDPNEIELFNVLKGDEAIERYGKKAKHGVIEITTKRNKKAPSFNEYMKKQ